MPNPNLKTISPSFFSKKSGEEQIDEKKLDSYKLANISLVAFLGIINHFSNYQNQEMDNEKPDYKNKLIESVFSLNDDDEKNLNPEYFKLLAGLSEAENIAEREIINTGEKQNGNLPQFLSEQLLANCIDAVCPESSVGKFGLGFKTIFGMLSRLPFGSQAVIHSHKNIDDYTFALIQTGKNSSNNKSQLIASINNAQIQYYLNQSRQKGIAQNVWKADTSSFNGTKITLVNSDKNGFKSEYLDEFYKGLQYHRFNPNVKICVMYKGKKEIINEDCVKDSKYPEIKVKIESNYIQFEDFGSGGNPVQFLMGSSKSDKKTTDLSLQNKIELHDNEADTIVFTCANVVLSRYKDIRNISSDSILKGMQIQLTENALSFSQSRREWSATQNNPNKGLIDTASQIIESFGQFVKTTQDEYLKIKVLNTILAWYDSLKGEDQINKSTLSDLPIKLRAVVEPIINSLKQKKKLLIPNTKEFDSIDFQDSVVRVSEHILLRYTPEGFGKKIPNLSNSGIELWVVKMKSRLDQEKLFALVEEIKTKEVSPKTIQSAISIKIDKPSQIWIDESIYQRYLDLKQSWKHEKDQVKQKEIGEEFLIYKSMLEVAINQEDSYSGKIEQEKVKLAGLKDEEIKNTDLDELQEKQELNFVEKRLQNRCMELWSMQENIFNPELRNKDNLKPMKVEIDFVTENDSSDHFNYELAVVRFEDELVDFDYTISTKRKKMLIATYRKNDHFKSSYKTLNIENIDLLEKIYEHINEIKKQGALKLNAEFKNGLEKLVNENNDLTDEQNLENFYYTLLNIVPEDYIRPQFQGPWRIIVDEGSLEAEIVMINSVGVAVTLNFEGNNTKLLLEKYLNRPQIPLIQSNFDTTRFSSIEGGYFDWD